MNKQLRNWVFTICFITTKHSRMYHTNIKEACQDRKRRITILSVLCTCATLGLSLQISLTKCTHFNVLILKTPTRFGSHWPITRKWSCIRQSLGHTIIFNIRNCGEIISVRFTEANIYTEILKY
jgi:hypothetical protein